MNETPQNDIALEAQEQLRKKFSDMPVEIYLENFATPAEKNIIENTFFIVDKHSQKIGGRGMIIHLGHGYFMSALHCFKGWLDLSEGSEQSLTLQGYDRAVITVPTKVVCTGADFYESKHSRQGRDWIVFQVRTNDATLPHMPLEQLVPPITESEQNDICCVGVPGNIKIPAVGSDGFENIGQQMSVRSGNQITTLVRKVRELPLEGDYSEQIKIELVLTPGYSGGPIISNRSTLLGFTYGTYEDVSFGFTTNFILGKLREKGVTFFDPTPLPQED